MIIITTMDWKAGISQKSFILKDDEDDDRYEIILWSFTFTIHG